MSTNNSSVDFDTTESQIIRFGAVLSNLNDSKESVTTKTKLVVDISVNTPGGASALLAELESLVFKSNVSGWNTREVHPSVQSLPVNTVIGTFKLPVEHDMGLHTSVPYSVASWKELSALAEVNTYKGVWEVASSEVDEVSANQTLWSTSSYGGDKHLYLSQKVWVLVCSGLTECSKEAKCTLVIEVVGKLELVRRLREVDHGIHKLVCMAFLWSQWDRSEPISLSSHCLHLFLSCHTSRQEILSQLTLLC